MKSYKITSLAISAVMLGAAISATIVPTAASAAVNATSNTVNCEVKATGKTNTAGNSDSRFTISGNMVSAEFEVKGEASCKMDVILASWQAPDADQGAHTANRNSTSL